MNPPRTLGLALEEHHPVEEECPQHPVAKRALADGECRISVAGAGTRQGEVWVKRLRREARWSLGKPTERRAEIGCQREEPFAVTGDLGEEDLGLAGTAEAAGAAEDEFQPLVPRDDRAERVDERRHLGRGHLTEEGDGEV